jgi:hypothetical protein
MDRSAGPPCGTADGRFRIPPSSGGNNGRLQVNKIAAPGLPMGRPALEISERELDDPRLPYEQAAEPARQSDGSISASRFITEMNYLNLRKELKR